MTVKKKFGYGGGTVAVQQRMIGAAKPTYDILGQLRMRDVNPGEINLGGDEVR